MDYQADIRFVDAHTESIGGNHDPMLSGQPALLSGILGLVAQSGMIESSGNFLLVEPLGYFFGLLRLRV